jgi:hypothetical protein
MNGRNNEAAQHEKEADADRPGGVENVTEPWLAKILLRRDCTAQMEQHN